MIINPGLLMIINPGLLMIINPGLLMIINPGLLMIGKKSYGQMIRPSRCSQHQTGFMFGEHPRKPIILECLVPNLKDGGGSVTIWAAIFWCTAGSTKSDNKVMRLIFS
jgi:hypothetical protein